MDSPFDPTFDPPSLSDEVRSRPRLPGGVGVTPEEVALLEELLDHGLFDQGPSFEETLTGAARATYEASWARTRAAREESSSCVIARPERLEDRPDIVARFAAHVFAESRAKSRSYAGWFVSGWLARRRFGETAITGMIIEPYFESATGITPSVLRAVSAPKIKAQAIAYLLDSAEWIESAERLGLAGAGAEEKDAARAVAEAVKPRELRRGRNGYGEDFYRRVAFEYLDLVAKHGPKGVLPRIAELEGVRLRRRVSREAARDWVHRARELGFLAETTAGIARAEPGPNLYQLTESDTREEQNDG